MACNLNILSDIIFLNSNFHQVSAPFWVDDGVLGIELEFEIIIQFCVMCLNLCREKSN